MEDIVKILIADDNKAIVSFMKSYIEKENKYTIIGICEDGQREIEMIEQLKPDVVITDIRKKNKWAGLDIIRKYQNKEYKPIFFVVSASAVYHIADMRELGIKYFLNKPFEEQDFMRILNNAYNEIYPKEIITTNKSIADNRKSNYIIKLFDTIKKRIGI